MTPLVHVHPNLYIGNDTDAPAVLVTQRTVRKTDTGGENTSWSSVAAPGWAVVHAAKSPWHANMVGYPGGAAPEGSPERWTAVRGRRMALNLVDAAPPLLFLPTVLAILDQAAKFIQEQLSNDNKVLVHCNMGLSRSPATVLWWANQNDPCKGSYEEALAFLLENYPYAQVDSGIMQMVKENWRAS